MNSSLWQTCGGLGTGEPDIDMNRIAGKIIDNLGTIKIRSVGVIKINGQTSIFLTSPGLEVFSFPIPLALESEAENLSLGWRCCTLVFQVGLPRRRRASESG